MESDFDLEVDRRIAALRANPDSFLQRFDTNQDGRIDGQEMAAVRAVITHEILTGAQATNSPLVVRDRFEFLSELGHGAQGVTHLARDRQTGDLVAVKVMNLKTAREWKAVDLFHREVEALRRLSHPQIPAFIDAFDIDETEFYLVQAFVPGDNLMVRLARQELMDEVRLRDIAEQLLEVLAYLHRQSPPVLHRDVKPANIIIGNDGKVSLVDFGAVQNQGSKGTTIIGTSGYMPAEQLIGRAIPASDVYAAGALLVHAATRVHPADLEVSRLKLQWRAQAHVGEALADWIDRLISPSIEDRPQNADEALRLLNLVGSQQVALIPKSASNELVTSHAARGTVSITHDDRGLTVAFGPPDWSSFVLWFLPFLVPVITLVAFESTLGATLVVLSVNFLLFFFVWVAVHRVRAVRTLKIGPAKTEFYVGPVLGKSLQTQDIDGPLMISDRRSNGLSLLMKNGKSIAITNQIGVDVDWAEHEIRKYLGDVLS
jgi:hypothetical protein